MRETQKTAKKEVNVHLSIYIPTDKEMTPKEAEAFAYSFLEAKGLDEFQIYKAEVQEKE